MNRLCSTGMSSLALSAATQSLQADLFGAECSIPMYPGVGRQGHTLHLEVKNTIFKSKKLLEESSGIGLTNTRRRLDLLYPGKYSLQVNEEASDNTFLVQLKLNVS